MPAFNATSLWEAFSGGTGWSGSAGELDDTARHLSFLNEFLGPSFGFDPNPAEGYQGWGSGIQEGNMPSSSGLGDKHSTHLYQFEPYGMQRAENEFRTAIGDPFGEEFGFQWETLSRYDPYEATSLLEGSIGAGLTGEYVGGDIGTEYGTDVAGALTSYKEGVRQRREGLTYEGQTAGMGLVSGTSGAVLRGGAAIGQAEEELAKAYEGIEGLRGEHDISMETADVVFESSIDDALQKYLRTIQTEKQSWFDSLMSSVNSLQARTPGQWEGYQSSVIAGMEAGGFQLGEDWLLDKLEAGLDIDFETQKICPDGSVINRESTCPDLEEGCGVGEIRIDGVCTPIEGIPDNPETGNKMDCAGILGGQSVTDECGVCGGPGPIYGTGQCQEPYNDPPDCAGIPGGTTTEDICGVCGGDGSSCAEPEDCAGVAGGTAVEDECGVCGGDGSSCADLGVIPRYYDKFGGTVEDETEEDETEEDEIEEDEIEEDVEPEYGEAHSAFEDLPNLWEGTPLGDWTLEDIDYGLDYDVLPESGDTGLTITTSEMDLNNDGVITGADAALAAQQGNLLLAEAIANYSVGNETGFYEVIDPSEIEFPEGDPGKELREDEEELLNPSSEELLPWQEDLLEWYRQREENWNHYCSQYGAPGQVSAPGGGSCIDSTYLSQLQDTLGEELFTDLFPGGASEEHAESLITLQEVSETWSNQDTIIGCAASGGTWVNGVCSTTKETGGLG